MTDTPEFQDLYGLCPACSGAESPDPDNTAFSAVDIASSDKYQKLFWSDHYQTYVCRTCKIAGEDEDTDMIKNERDQEAEEDRQRMGYGRTYEPN